MAKKVTDSPTSARAAQRRAGADRAREWRAAAKRNGKPLPRDADAALVEAMSFLLARHKRDGVNIGPSGGVQAVDPAELGLLAKLLLERDGYDAVLAGRAVKARLAPRPEHRNLRSIPSLRNVDPETIPTPPKGWSSPIQQLVGFVNGRSPSFVA